MCTFVCTSTDSYTLNAARNRHLNCNKRRILASESGDGNEANPFFFCVNHTFTSSYIHLYTFAFIKLMKNLYVCIHTSIRIYENTCIHQDEKAYRQMKEKKKKNSDRGKRMKRRKHRITKRNVGWQANEDFILYFAYNAVVFT